jgi:hypothetical protein
MSRRRWKKAYLKKMEEETRLRKNNEPDPHVSIEHAARLCRKAKKRSSAGSYDGCDKRRKYRTRGFMPQRLVRR